MASMENSVVGSWHLLQLPDCTPTKRYDEWQKLGALGGEKSIGCGLNALAFLGIFTREQGLALLSELKARDDGHGTSFREMMSFVFKAGSHDITQHEYDITTLEGIHLFEQDMKSRLRDGSCTVIKLLRIPETNERNESMDGKVELTGHSVVLSKVHGEIILIDPQQGKLKKHDSVKALKVWGDLGYQYVYVMGTNSPKVHGHVSHRAIDQELASGIPTFRPMNVENKPYPVRNPFPQFFETPEAKAAREARTRLFLEGKSILPKFRSGGSRKRKRKQKRKTRHIRSS